MIAHFTRVALAALLMTSSSQALAQASGWTISEASGPVFLHRDGERMAARRGAAIMVGDMVATGANGRAVLVHRQDFVTIAANSQVTIPAATSQSGLTRFFQTLGNAIFRVQKRGTPHFSVDTPYLAAVVKGTTFSITVGPTDASLQVTEGLVEVATVDGGARDLIRPGSVAMISAADLYRLNVLGDQPRVLDSPLRSQDDAPAAPPDGAAPPEASASSGPLPSADPPAPEFADAPPILEVAVVSKPADLGKATGGLLRGEQPTAFAAALAAPATLQPGLTSPAAAGPERPGEKDGTDNTSGGRSPDAAGKPATGSGKPAKDNDSANKPGKGSEDKPAKGDDRDKPDEYKPNKDADKDKPGKEGKDKPAKDDDDKPGKNNKPGKDKPEKDDKPGKDDDKPERGGKGKEREGKDDKDKPGKGGKD